MDLPNTNRFVVANAKDVSKQIPPSSVVTKKTVAQQLVRSRQDVQKWRNALNSAESRTNPSRTELLKIYQDVMLDAHLSSVWNTRVNNILSEEFFLVNSSLEKDVEATTKLMHRWFECFMTYAMESILYGHSLIQFGDIVDDVPEIELVPRQYVVPETSKVKQALYGTSSDGISYDESPYKEWLIEVGNKYYDFGLLNLMTPIALWKKNAFGAWGEYLDMFGMPIRIGKTDIRDEERRRQMERMMETMGKASYGVFDDDDKVELVQAAGASGNPVYDSLIERVNSEISKTVLGQTMTADSGSSLSQSEVHERVMNDYRQSDKRFIRNEVNNKLIPWMVSNGILPEGMIFVWDTKEKRSKTDKIDDVVKLSAHYNMSPEFVKEYTGIDVEEMKSADPLQSKSIMMDVKDIYDEFLKD